MPIPPIYSHPFYLRQPRSKHPIFQHPGLKPYFYFIIICPTREYILDILEIQNHESLFAANMT